jgi:hypothetical protein
MRNHAFIPTRKPGVGSVALSITYGLRCAFFVSHHMTSKEIASCFLV